MVQNKMESVFPLEPSGAASSVATPDPCSPPSGHKAGEAELRFRATFKMFQEGRPWWRSG